MNRNRREASAMNIMRFLIVLSLCSGLTAGTITSNSFSSSATVINFDELTGGSCNLCGPSVTNQYQPFGVTFDNPSFPGQATADTNLTPFIPGASSPNALFIFQGGQLNQSPAAPFQILFSTSVNSIGFDYGSSANAFLQLQAYSISGQLLESLTFTGGSAPIGAAGFAGIQNSTAIARLDLSYHPLSDSTRTLNFSIDNLMFESSTPEPAVSGLVAAGSLAIVLVSRRRSAKSPRS